MNNPEQRKLHKKPRGYWVATTHTYKLNNRFKFAVSKIPHYANKIARCNHAHAQEINIPIIENKECSLEEIEKAWPYEQVITIYLKNGYKKENIQHDEPTIVCLRKSKHRSLNKVREESWIKNFPVDPVEWTQKL